SASRPSSNSASGVGSTLSFRSSSGLVVTEAILARGLRAPRLSSPSDGRETSPVRVLVAPDRFGGTMRAHEAAAAIARGWSGTAPSDEPELLPLSDGGPGFIEVLHDALGGERRELPVRGPAGDPVTAQLLLRDGSAYVESAQAAGRHLVADDARDPATASTY